jgi:MarR family transcriptional regulator for hemolysin
MRTVLSYGDPVHADLPWPKGQLAIGRHLAVTHKAIHAWTEAALARHDSSLVTWIVLNAVAESPAPGLSQRELADGMGIGGPALVRHIDRLEAEGLVRRDRDEHDRRVMRVTLTPAGRRHHQELARIMGRLDQDLRSHLTATEQRTLHKVLDTIARYAAETPLP